MAKVAKDRQGSNSSSSETSDSRAARHKPPPILPATSSRSLWLWFAAICLLTVATRFHGVTQPEHVCWDETHFGKMGSWYINRTFFFDVHPPLGKMLIAASGHLSGYDGRYPFEKPGDKYNGTRYEGMRIFCTALGATIVPMAFSTVHDLTGSAQAAVMASAYLLFDVGMLTLNQYILLDPLLLCFMTASVWGMVKVSGATRRGRVFRWDWWAWLWLTGTALACTISVKFVGLFVVLLVGVQTASDLYAELGDLARPVSHTVRQFAARALTLIVWPAALYALFFYVHLAVLSHSGNGDGFYSSAFQSRLIGNSLHNASMPRQVAYGALVTLKNHKTGGGYLHSHYHLYPKEAGGASQQQITTYTHKDENNRWLVKPYNREPAVEEADVVQLLRHGDLVRLEHTQTRRNLHAHREQAPLTKKHYQVTGYGENGTGDANDIWRVLVVGARDVAASDPANLADPVLTVTSQLRLVHYLQNCALTTSGKQLPKWGFEQQEVSCNPNLRDRSATWNVEDNVFEKLPSVSFQVYAPGFVARFLESHAVMFQGNAGLKPKEGEVTSRPWQWPINYRGQFFSGSTHRVYLLGNPVIWWSNLGFLALYLLVAAGVFVRRQRGTAVAGQSSSPSPSPTTSASDRSLSAATWLFAGWLLHYLPFWAMGRVLYFHHYFPALIFNSMLTGVMYDYLTVRLDAWLRHALLGAALATLGYSFVLFAPLAYGMDGPSAAEVNGSMSALRWLDSWEF